MGLERYREMRDFQATPEPAGAEPAKGARGDRFVIQKHAARRLHWDFRLELDGVLKSWAVPKGPSLDPEEKRLAVEVEDHPVEYGDFEGVIPQGQYGGGTVMLWDRGRWRPEGDARRGLAKGHLRFRLSGERLQGAWDLIRVGDREGAAAASAASSKPSWLLVKVDDDAAQRGSGARVVEEGTLSVATGRPMEAIARDRDRVWHSKESALHPEALPGARRAEMPASYAFQLATLVGTVPAGPGWLHEIKFDGYRVFLRIEDGRVRFITRGQADWTERFQLLAPDARSLPARQAVIDGEIVVFDSRGRTSFQDLQQALSARRGDLRLQAFDLLYLDGFDLTEVPLVERKALLRALIEPLGRGARIGYSDHVEGLGEAFFTQSCRHALEGVVSKRADAPYRGGRGRAWAKVKCQNRQEVVIGGFTDPGGTRTGLGALLVGVYDEQGRLKYAGKVGTGFSEATLRALRERLEPMERPQSPFVGAPARRKNTVHWVEPKLLAEVAFTEWTRDGVMRHPSFQGLREDKPAREVKREVPVEASRAAGLPLTNPDKVLFPETGLTKAGLAEHYLRVAEAMMPHVRGRPLMLVRCPSGVSAHCFHQKHIESPGPGLEAVETGDDQPMALLASPEGLVSLVQMGVLEVHIWGSRAPDLERPDRLVLDLDPDEGVPWARVAGAALALRARLEDLGLASFALSTGGKGLHVVAPLTPAAGWDEVKAFARALAEEQVRAAPTQYTATLSKAKRKGRTFIDYLRNGRGATAVAPWSTRARAGATVAVPLAWDEIDPRGERPTLGVADVAARLTRDPWTGYFEQKQKLTAAARRAVAP